MYTPIGDEGCPEGEPAVHTCTVYTPIGDEGCLEGKPAVHACTVYTPIDDEGCLEGEPAVYTLVQCTLLLVMRDVCLCITCLYSVHSYW